jgi:3-hydroxyisobutyrate dehydrogenase
MVGGDEEAYRRAQPLFEHMCRLTVLQGGPGTGQHAKMVNQITIAGGMIGLCEALLYAYESGLDLETVVKTISDGAAGSWSLTNYAPRMMSGDFAPGFKIEHFIKDLGIALVEARRMNLSLPGLGLAEHLYRTAQSYGMGERGTHALLLALAETSQVDWASGERA